MEKLRQTIKLNEWRPDKKFKLPEYIEDLPKNSRDLVIAIEKLYAELSTRVNFLLTAQDHIADADGTLADLTTKFNTLLSQLETKGFLSDS